MLSDITVAPDGHASIRRGHADVEMDVNRLWKAEENADLLVITKENKATRRHLNC